MMDVRELNFRVDQLGQHVKILDYNLDLSDNDITDLAQDYDYCYDSYFKSKKESRKNENRSVQ